MDYSQSKELAEDVQLLSKFGKLLSHPARIYIITKIANNGNKLLVERVTELEYSPRSMAIHLGDLMNIGLVYIRKNEQKEQVYSLDLEVYSQFKELFEKFFNTSWGNLEAKNKDNSNYTDNFSVNPKVETKADKDLLSFIKST